ncbi:MAG: NAD(P)H-dependent oxidoreductase subunit E [Elusimicrobiota bacterium]
MEFIKYWKDKPGNLIAILHKVQEEYGYVPRNVAFKLVNLLNVPLGKLYGVITFYHFFKLTAPGRNKIAVCTGTACYLKGAFGILEELKNILGIDIGEVTEDGKFSIEAVRCIGCCGLAPVISINGKVYGEVKKEKLPEILAEYQ